MASESWALPIKVALDANGFKTLFVDKPLPKPVYDIREWHTKYYSKVLESLFLAPEDAPMELAPKTSVDAAPETDARESIVDVLKSPVSNVTYNEWTLGSYNVLVRCKIHAYHTESAGRVSLPSIAFPKLSTLSQPRMLDVRARMQYQMENGFETPSTTEFDRWWLHAYVRPDAHLALGHVNAQTSQLEFFEYKTIPDVYAFSSQAYSAFKRMHGVLTRVYEHAVAPGHYLLTHDVKQSFLRLYGPAPESSAEDSTGAVEPKIFSLASFMAESVTLDEKNPPYRPVSWQPSFVGQVPGTLPPKPPGLQATPNKAHQNQSAGKKGAKPQKGHIKAPKMPTVFKYRDLDANE